MKKTAMRLAIFSALLLLAACGDPNYASHEKTMTFPVVATQGQYSSHGGAQ